MFFNNGAFQPAEEQYDGLKRFLVCAVELGLKGYRE